MIGQINIEKSLLNAPNDRSLFVAVASVVNSLVDAVNTIQKEREAEKAFFSKMENVERPENVHPDAESRPENVQDKFAEQRKWIGKICKFWDIDNDYLYYGPLTKISDTGPYYYECNHRICYVHCEPVKDDVIYKGE